MTEAMGNVHLIYSFQPARNSGVTRAFPSGRLSRNALRRFSCQLVAWLEQEEA